MISSKSMAINYIDGYEQKNVKIKYDYLDLPLLDNIGSIEQFREWCVEQPCIITGCEGCNEFVPIQGVYGINHYLGVPLTASIAILFKNLGPMGLLRYYFPQCEDMAPASAYAWFVLEAKKKIIQWCQYVQVH
ncbi:MAG: hypothetical protein LPH21_18670 [Shewanella sp.]|nr:hypothetical protein [Shewanella sp.]